MNVIEQRSGVAGTRGPFEVSPTRPSGRPFGCAVWHPPSSHTTPNLAGRHGLIGATCNRIVPHLKDGACCQGRSHASPRRGNRHWNRTLQYHSGCVNMMLGNIHLCEQWGCGEVQERGTCHHDVPGIGLDGGRCAPHSSTAPLTQLLETEGSVGRRPENLKPFGPSWSIMIVRDGGPLPEAG